MTNTTTRRLLYLIHVVRVSARLFLALAVFLLPSCRGQPPSQPHPVRLDPAIQGPSGIAYHPIRHTLFVVGDKGDIVEMRTGGTVVNKAVLPDTPDLEGITFSMSSGFLYLIEEGRDCILEVDPSSLAVNRVVNVPREYNGAIILSKEGHGLEGIAYLPASDPQGTDSFMIANQGSPRRSNDLPALLEIVLPPVGHGGSPQSATIVRHVRMPVADLSGLYFDDTDQYLYVISDRNDCLLQCKRDGSILSQTHLPGIQQEGIARDAGGNLYIAQDTGGILKLPFPLERGP